MSATTAFAPDSPVVRPVRASDGKFSELLLVQPARPATWALYWLPGMGMPARHYLPFAQALAARGIAVALHEWRGVGSSDLRASRQCDWGYCELLQRDIPAGLTAARAAMPGVRWALGGHSLGGQLASVYAGLQPTAAERLILVASGAPWWRAFPALWSISLRMVFAIVPPLTSVLGHFPGRRFGFAGREARGVMADWARSGRTGRYAARGMDTDIEAAMQLVQWPLLALHMQNDHLGPAGSLRFLLQKMPWAPSEVRELSAGELACAADHFAWIKHPDAVALRISAWLRTGATREEEC